MLILFQKKLLLNSFSSMKMNLKPVHILKCTHSRQFSLLSHSRNKELASSGPFTTRVFELKDSLELAKIPEPQPTHGILTCTAVFKGFMPDHLDMVAYFARYSAHMMGIPCTPTIHQETRVERWSMPRGPFVHGTTKEVFERKTYYRALQLIDGETESVNWWIQYVNSKLPSGVDMRVDTFTWLSESNIADLKEKVALQEEKVMFDDIDPSLVKQPQDELNFDQKVRSRAQEIVKELSK